MKKSKFIFIILFIIYLLIGILSPLDVLNISDNLLFALSSAALLVSASDVISKIRIYRNTSNTYYTALKITIDFLDNKIKCNQTSNFIMNVRNVKGNLEVLQKKNYQFCHPDDYIKKKSNTALNVISLLFFIVGIASFIFIPFIKKDVSNSAITSVITILAFAAMNLSLFLDEIIIEKQTDYNNLINEKHLVIQGVFWDFQNYFQTNMFYRNDLIAYQDAFNTLATSQAQNEKNDLDADSSQADNLVTSQEDINEVSENQDEANDLATNSSSNE